MDFFINANAFGNNFAMNYYLFPTHKGVSVHGDDKKVVSFIDCNGQKKLKSFHEKNKIVFWHMPFARGVQFFFCGFLALFQAVMIVGDLCGGVVVKKSKNELHGHYKRKLVFFALTIVLASVVAVFLFGLLPMTIGWLVIGVSGNGIVRKILIFFVKSSIFFLLVLLLRVFPTINELFAFNRASVVELKKLLGKNLKNSKEKRRKASGVHAREIKAGVNNSNKNNKIKSDKRQKVKANSVFFRNNSINFLNFFIFVLFLDFLMVTLLGANYGAWFNHLLNVAIFLVCISVGYEILQLFESVRWLRFLSWMTGVFVFEKPTRTHLETAAIALTEINLLCTQKEREVMQDDNNRAFSVVYLEVKNKLRAAGVTDKSDADWLVATVLGKNRAEVKLVSSVTEKQYEDIMKAVERRCKGESLDNIFGWTQFYGLDFDVNKKVLTPRMETELLVERVLGSVKNYKKCTILDVGTGSGAIAVSLAKNSDAAVTAVDVSKSALVTAQANAKKNAANVEFLHSNLFEGLKRKRKFDIIVSNPPYIPSAEIEKLDRNVRECDPLLALDGGEDGLDFYREISSKATARLNNGGMIFYEVGKGQAAAVKKILKECGFEEIKIFKDYNNIERIVCGKFK